MSEYGQPHGVAPRGTKRPRIANQVGEHMGLKAASAISAVMVPPISSEVASWDAGRARNEGQGNDVMAQGNSAGPLDRVSQATMQDDVVLQGTERASDGDPSNETPVTEAVLSRTSAELEQQGLQQIDPTLGRRWLKAVKVINQHVVRLDQQFAREMRKLSQARKDVNGTTKLRHDLDEEKAKNEVLQNQLKDCRAKLVKAKWLREEDHVSST